ncbi:hypothetical protein [Bradyrhizobium sacchari]|nr:hypothetical protein [Bradyrhizobium sacchari]
MAVFVTAMYLLSGVFHGAFDIDVTSPAGGSEIALILDDAAAGDKGHKAVADHHCHGCFSVAVAQVVQPAVATDVLNAPVPQQQPALISVAPDTDSPPPKRLT